MVNTVTTKNNPVSFDDFGIVLVLNFVRTNNYLNFFSCLVVRSYFFIIKCFLKFSICSVFNAIFKLVERKLMIRIVSWFKIKILNTSILPKNYKLKVDQLLLGQFITQVEFSKCYI